VATGTSLSLAPRLPEPEPARDDIAAIDPPDCFLPEDHTATAAERALQTTPTFFNGF